MQSQEICHRFRGMLVQAPVLEWDCRGLQIDCDCQDALGGAVDVLTFLTWPSGD